MPERHLNIWLCSYSIFVRNWTDCDYFFSIDVNRAVVFTITWFIGWIWWSVVDHMSHFSLLRNTNPLFLGEQRRQDLICSRKYIFEKLQGNFRQTFFYLYTKSTQLATKNPKSVRRTYKSYPERKTIKKKQQQQVADQSYKTQRAQCSIIFMNGRRSFATHTHAGQQCTQKPILFIATIEFWFGRIMQQFFVFH